MATETVASDHAYATDEQIVKKEKSEAIAQMIASLANEDEDKHNKPKDAQSQANPSSKTAGEAEGDETKTELAAVKVENSDDTPSLEASAEDKLKNDKVEDAQTPAAPFSKTEVEAEGDEKKAEPAVVAVEKTDDPVSLEANVADNLKEEDKALILDSQTISVAAEPTHDAAKSEPEQPQSTEQRVEKESTETEEKEQSKTAAIPEASAETVEKSSNTAEANPVMESEAKVEKETEVLEASAQKEGKPKPEPEPEPVATEVQEKTEEPEKESQEKPQEAEQPSTVTIPEPSAESNGKLSDATEEEKTRDPSAEVLKETNHCEAGPNKTVKAEPVVSVVEDIPKESEKKLLEQKDEEQPKTVTIPEVPSIETGEAIEEKTREPGFETEVLKETKHETEPTETEKAEPVVTKVNENPCEPEKQSCKQEEEEQPKTVIPETPKTEAESAEKPDDIVEAHPPKESEIEAVEEISNSESDAVPGKAEKPEPAYTEVDQKPRELLEVAEQVGETSEDQETKQEIVPEATTIEETSVDTIKEPASLKEEKTDKEEVINIPENIAQISLNEKDQEAPANVVEPEVAEKIVEEDGKKEPSFNDVLEGVSKEVDGVIKIPEQASIDREAKADPKEEREYSAPTNVVEKVAVAAANDDKREPEAPEAVQVSSREPAEVEIKKVEEHNEVKTATTEAGGVQVESVKDDRPAVDNEKEAHTDTKVDEISSAVSQPIRETLASKFEEEESAKTGDDNLEKEQTEEPVKTEVQVPEPPTKESDATKTSKDLPKETPAKPAQKQSNNIISKVKQSLVKAKKAITGKSPSSKNHSSEAKEDIKVK